MWQFADLRFADPIFFAKYRMEVPILQIIIHGSKKTKVLFHIDKVMVGFVSHLTSASMI